MASGLVFEVGSGVLGEGWSLAAPPMVWDESERSALDGSSAGLCGAGSILRFLE